MQGNRVPTRRLTERSFLLPPSERWADVEPDLGIDQGFLCGSDAVDGQLGIQGCAAFDKSKGNRPQLEVPCGAANKTNRTPIKHQICPGRWQRIDAAV